MQFTAWSKREQDPGRRRRWLIAYGTALTVLAGTLAAGVAFGGSAQKPKEKEEEVDVKFMERAEEAPKPEPPPPPPPPPPPAPKPKAVPPPEAAPPPLATAQPIEAPPTEIPKAKPEEGDPDKAKPAVNMDHTGTAKGSIYGVPGGTGNTIGGTAPSAAPAPAVAKPEPIALPEDADPPEPIAREMPEFPSEARAQGIEAEVIVRYVITESGDVSDVKVLRGHPLFNDACVAAVKGWKFKPVVYQGHAIAIRRIHKFPFRIKS